MLHIVSVLIWNLLAILTKQIKKIKRYSESYLEIAIMAG